MWSTAKGLFSVVVNVEDWLPNAILLAASIYCPGGLGFRVPSTTLCARLSVHGLVNVPIFMSVLKH